MMLRSLSFRLFMAFLLVALVAIGIVALSASRTTSARFSSYLVEADWRRADSFRNHLSQLYQEDRGWNNLRAVLSSLSAISGDRLLVTDPPGIVLADSAGVMVGQKIEPGQWGVAFPIATAGQTVGVLHFVPGSGSAFVEQMQQIMQQMMGPGSSGMMGAQTPGQGGGMMGGGSGGGMMGQGGGMMGNTTPPETGGVTGTATVPGNPSPAIAVPTPVAGDFLRAVRNSLWLAAAGAGLAAALLSLLFTRYITQPLLRLRQAAGRIAAGELSFRVQLPADNNEVAELARSFNHMAEALSRNEQLRRNLVADIAHELRTPLTVLQGSLEAIQDGVLPATPERLDSLRHEVTLLSRLVDDLRDLSLAEAGQLKLEMAPLDLFALLPRVVQPMESQSQQHGIKLSLELKTDRAIVKGDAQRLAQAVTNLLSNALRYTPTNGEITVTLTQHDKTALVTVADTGIGIPAQELPRIFDRFYRVDKSRARATGGSGLGLAIVKQIITLHGGQVWAESQPGQGSRFTVALPLAG